jgi:hypothetical protein
MTLIEFLTVFKALYDVSSVLDAGCNSVDEGVVDYPVAEALAVGRNATTLTARLRTNKTKPPYNNKF